MAACFDILQVIFSFENFVYTEIGKLSKFLNYFKIRNYSPKQIKILVSTFSMFEAPLLVELPHTVK